MQQHQQHPAGQQVTATPIRRTRPAPLSPQPDPRAVFLEPVYSDGPYRRDDLEDEAA